AAHQNGVFLPADATLNWQPYSEEAFIKARASGKIVLVKFTATWCISCQWVDSNVYHNVETAQMLKKKGVITFKADLTADDAPGQAHLKKLNPAGGIPLTAIYAHGAPAPMPLPSAY